MPEKTDKAAPPPKPDPVAVIADALKAAGVKAAITATPSAHDTAYVVIVDNRDL